MGSVIIRQPHAAAGKNTVVPLEVAIEVEMGGKPGIVQHAPGVAADREIFASFDTMMLIEHKHVRMMGYGAPINHGLTIVFAGRFQIVQLEQPVGGGVKTDISRTRPSSALSNGNSAVVNEPWVGKAMRTESEENRSSTARRSGIRHTAPGRR